MGFTVIDGHILPPYAAAQSPALSLGLSTPPDDTTSHATAARSLVLQELATVAHLITARFAPGLPSLPTFRPVVRPPPAPSVNTAARSSHSEFDTTVTRTAVVAGLLRCVPADVFRRLQETASRLHVPFPLDTAFLAAGPGPLRIPLVDAKILDAFVSDPKLGIAGTLELYRGQTSLDSRPNKALRPWLYQVHLPAYPDPPLLCSIAEHGIVPPWINPDQRLGARPLPGNYMGAINGALIVTDKLLADYYKGRCLVASLPVLVADPSFHSSAFALVPKKDKPLYVDDRIIHDLSAPAGVSVNDLTDSSASPDATWDPFTSTALRICDLRRRYPGYTVYAMVADIADAFHHVPVHAHHASAFGGKLPRSSHGFISGMAVFGWTSSPSFFAVFGKAVRHYQRTGASRVKGFIEPFWIFQWVDDIVLIEVDIDDRLQKAEKRLRDGVKLVFGSDGWHEGKFTTWSRIFHAVGIDWNIPAEFITVPQRKVDKTHRMLTDVLGKPFVSMKQLYSLVGVLRHVITIILITKPFIQRLIAVHTRCRRGRRTGVAVSMFLQKDLVRWKDLVFQNEFAGIPMRLLDRNRVMDDIWLVQTGQQGVVVTSMALRERVLVVQSNSTEQDTTVAATLSRVTSVWGPRLEIDNAWHHISIHSDCRWITRIIDKMNCRTTEGQEALRQYRARRQRIEEKTAQLKRAAVKRASVTEGTLGRYSRNFKFWESFCNDFGFPVWIDELPRAQQARMVGLFAGLCASEGHNRAKTGNKFQTFDGKMAATAFPHKAIRNARFDYHDPEFELIDQGYKRTNSSVDRKQPVTTPMLRKIQELLETMDQQAELLWG